MSNKIDIDEYKVVHQGNLKRLLAIYWSNKSFWKNRMFWVAFTLSVIAVAVTILTKTDSFATLSFLSDKMIGIMPNILGFNLGGYVLLIGLNSQNILDEITEPINNERYSLFQKQSSVFAFSILIQALAIIVSFVIVTVMHLGTEIYLSPEIADAINYITLLAISFLSIYSLLLIFKIIINIFNFGQTLHFFVRLERLEKQNNPKKEEVE